MGTRRKKACWPASRPPKQVRRNRVTTTFTDREPTDLRRRPDKAGLPVAKIIDQAVAEALGSSRWRKGPNKPRLAFSSSRLARASEQRAEQTQPSHPTPHPPSDRPRIARYRPARGLQCSPLGRPASLPTARLVSCRLAPHPGPAGGSPSTQGLFLQQRSLPRQECREQIYLFQCRLILDARGTSSNGGPWSLRPRAFGSSLRRPRRPPIGKCHHVLPPPIRPLRIVRPSLPPIAELCTGPKPTRK
jgi:hypothetical protein